MSNKLDMLRQKFPACEVIFEAGLSVNKNEPRDVIKVVCGHARKSALFLAEDNPIEDQEIIAWLEETNKSPLTEINLLTTLKHLMKETQ